jgi:NAD+ synthase (glutamine-hydrolysing)
MKVFLGQINTTPGDFVGNCKKIVDSLHEVEPGTVLAVFPELSIPGYLSRDLMFEHHYVDKNLRWLNNIVSTTDCLPNLKDVHVVVGYIDRNHSGVGKPFRNMLAVICNGTIVGTYQKHLLPFYDVFDEGRYYEPGKDLLVLNLDGHKVGFTICEDVWNCKDTDSYNYKDNPVQSYKEVGIDVLVNISSSPYVQGKPHRRQAMLHTVASSFTLIYVNQVGGQDDLVFDGHSTIIKDGLTIHLFGSKETNKTLHTQDRPVLPFGIRTEVEQLHDMLIMGLKDYIVKSGFKQIVLGSSGGIDSAVVAALAAEAIGPENVHCIMMPSIHSSEGSVTDAKDLHKNIGCNEYLIRIDHESLSHTIKCGAGIESFDGHADPGFNMEEKLYSVNKQYAPNADENIQARLRGMYVMYFSNALNCLPLTTGNKTELATGYCTLYGDMNGGFAPISDLYKMQVYEIARYINARAKREIIPQSIIDKAPSAELAPGQTDEASLLPYPILDKIVQAYIEQYVDCFEDFKQFINHISHDWAKVKEWANNASDCEKQFNRIIRLININEFKRRQAAPGIKLSKVAFGSGRRLPIVKKF